MSLQCMLIIICLSQNSLNPNFHSFQIGQKYVGSQTLDPYVIVGQLSPKRALICSFNSLHSRDFGTRFWEGFSLIATNRRAMAILIHYGATGQKISCGPFSVDTVNLGLLLPLRVWGPGQLPTLPRW